ncbi:MAG: hypothetical protein ABSG53_20055 [Thermoguttaceae bacterium]|jgi:hypothetical protein
MRRAIRIAVLVMLFLILAFLVWLRATPDGRDLADNLSDRSQEWRHGGEEQDAAEKLTAMGARFGRLPPENRLVSIDCNDKTLGDEGYRLVGKCFRLELASFIRCDLNDDRIQHLAGLSHLTSLTILDTPAVTDAGIKNIGSLRLLVGLLLNGTGVGDAGLKQIGQFPELATLDLSRTQVTDAGLPALNGLSKLQWLLLANTAVTDDGVARLDGLRALRQISLSGSKVTDQGKARLKKTYPGLTID